MRTLLTLLTFGVLAAGRASGAAAQSAPHHPLSVQLDFARAGFTWFGYNETLPRYGAWIGRAEGTWRAADRFGFGIAFAASTRTTQNENFGTLTAGPTFSPFPRLGLSAHVEVGVAAHRSEAGCGGQPGFRICLPPGTRETSYKPVVGGRIVWSPRLLAELTPSVAVAYARTVTRSPDFRLLSIGIGLVWSP